MAAPGTTQQLPAADRRAKVAKNALVSGIANAVVNGAIQYFLLAGETPITLSVDEISTAEHTVFGAAVPLAVSLAMILTAVTYVSLAEPKRPFWPHTAWLIVKHGFFAFGVLVSAAIAWQRVAGTVTVSLATAVAVLGGVAGVVAATVNAMTTTAALDVRR